MQDSEAPAAASGENSCALFAVLDTAHVLVENVAALRSLNKQSGTTESAAIATILADLASAGYDAEWTSLYAYQFGSPHSREHCFLVASPNGFGPDLANSSWPFVTFDDALESGRERKHESASPSLSMHSAQTVCCQNQQK